MDVKIATKDWHFYITSELILLPFNSSKHQNTQKLQPQSFTNRSGKQYKDIAIKVGRTAYTAHIILPFIILIAFSSVFAYFLI